MDIAAIGEILIDMTQTGTDENGTALFSACPGGAPANVAVAAARLGTSASFTHCLPSTLKGNAISSMLFNSSLLLFLA